jgi:phosphohistidine phosphatase
MKSLLIVRHAKSSWDLSTPNDIDRPLNDRGKKDAPAAAKRLFKKGIRIDAFVSSPAKRAKKTAKHFTKEYGVDPEDIILVPELYEAHCDDFYKVVSDLDDAYNTVAIFSHNPGITDFVNTLTEVKVDNIPTCGVFAVQMQIDSWNGFRDVEKKFWFFDYPKLND